MKPVSEEAARLHLSALFRTIVFFLAALMLVSCSQRQDRENSARIAKAANKEGFDTKEQEKNANFIVDAITDAYAEAEFAQLAQRKSTNGEVKAIAAVLEKDQAKMLTQLKGFAGTKGISIPTVGNQAARRKLHNLAEEEGTDFDTKWCKELVSKHEKNIQAFEEMWETTKDDDLKDLINESLPDLRTHLVKLNSCREKLAI